jgi:hypothetical protein
MMSDKLHDPAILARDKPLPVPTKQKLSCPTADPDVVMTEFHVLSGIEPSSNQ